MANSIYRGSDTTPTVIFATAAFPSTFTATDWIDVRGFTHIDFLVKLTSGQSVVDLELAVDFATANGPNAAAYPLQLEEYVAGPPVRAKQDRYVVDASGVFSGASGAYGLPVPVHGRYMRLNFKGGPSVGSDQAEVSAFRRSS